MRPGHPHDGFCVWLTGLSGAGKTTLATLLRSALEGRGRIVTLLDGDLVRATLSQGLGYSREERGMNVMRVALVAKEVVRHGGAAVCALVSPYEASRHAARETIGADRVVTCYVDAPLDVCERRDPKGLYARARRGEIPAFTGVSDPYEPPVSPDLHLRTSEADPAACVATILHMLEQRGFLGAADDVAVENP